MSTILTHSQKLTKLRVDLEDKISKKAKRQTRYSKYQSNKAILIKRTNINLDGGRWLEEVTPYDLIDNKGYTYQYSVLTLEELCELADEIFWVNLSKKD